MRRGAHPLEREVGQISKSLGLVAEAFLVTIRLHALFALMLTDFGLTTLFETAHGGCWLVGWLCVGKVSGSGDDFVERVFDDAFRAEGLEVGDEVTGGGLVDDGLDSDPAILREGADGGSAEGR